ncbi:hypothetical protein FHS04_000873 [Mesoflavibacter sabulilitoris]|nr:hypothetical protein [Mesoflavibacter zeaxanthinifaciens]MBB3123376.1 hypothetical protein [Mesoflavibacter zeaxanthinifaciens subsp. sabulilitoris]
MNSISGGTENSCHDEPEESTACEECQETVVTTQGSWQTGTYGWWHILFH